MKPPWLILLAEWRRQHGFGLTIPFVLGAMRMWPGQPLGLSSEARVQLRALIASVCDDAPDEVFIRLFPCDRVRELVLTPVGGPAPYCVAIPSATRSEPALYVDLDVLRGSQNEVDALVAELWRRYADAIQEGRFSVHAGTFTRFNDADLSFINAALTRSDEEDA